MCNPQLAIAAAAIVGGQYLQDRSLRKSIKASGAYQRAENERQKGYESQARKVVDTAREGFTRENVDDALQANITRLRDAFAAAGQTPSSPILASNSNNSIVMQSNADAYKSAAEDNLNMANLQAALEAFGQTLVDNNPLLADSAMAVKTAGNLATGSLGALSSEMQYAQTKAYNPLAQLLQTGGQLALVSGLSAPGTPGADPSLARAGGANTGTGAGVSVYPLPPLPKNPYTGTN
jgi:hypothetical protein